MDLTEVALGLPAGSDAPAIARRFVAEHTTHLPADLVEDATLLVSELVGNAVRYGQPAITLRMWSRPSGIGVGVHDTGGDIPALPDGRPDVSRSHGRGLLIVAALANSWGVTTSRPARGKTVWFELDRRD